MPPLYILEKNDFRIDPYLLKVVEKKGLINGPYGGGDKLMPHYNRFIKTFTMGEKSHPVTANEHDKIKFKKAEFFHPSHFQERRSIINRRETGDVERTFWCSTGLRVEAFQKYIDWLCDGESHEIHVILYSDKGTLFQEAFSTTDIKEIVRRCSEEPEYSHKNQEDLANLKEAEPMTKSSFYKTSPSARP
jgi:hypothetical protein